MGTSAGPSPDMRFRTGDTFRYLDANEPSFTVMRIADGYAEVQSLMGDGKVLISDLLASWDAGEIYRDKDEACK